MSLNRCVGIYGDTALIWCFPIEIFKAFKEVYILTYMFDAQIQKYYYDFYGLEYDRLYVEHVNDTYRFTQNHTEYDYKISNVDICENESLNIVGDDFNALSVSWFTRKKLEEGRPMINLLKNNVCNYFKHIKKSASAQNMWTTFKHYKKMLQGGGYTKGFVSVNARATNEYKHKQHLAYCANIFVNPVLVKFFAQRDIIIDEEKYALSELVQWVWRSAIRDGKDISIYIPSSRMRNIFKNWLQTVNYPRL